MAHWSKEEERHRLTKQIQEWNANRLDIFELSPPNEDLEFHGVMRFYVMDPNATKCVRVSSTATTRDVIETLIGKFRPDMRMLSFPNYALYVVHVNGEERKLQDSELPLLVQLNWGEDDREGRFVFKNEDYKPSTIVEGEVAPGGFKRKLSKREKKEQKKKEKEAKLKGKENETPKDSIAEKLYNELPETSFTRTISNPEVVMRRRRQQKLEKKLQQFKSRDGGPDSGGTLKIYGDHLRPDLPYKTLLLSTADTAAYVVKETLEKYGMEKEDPLQFCLLQCIMDPNKEGWGVKESMLDDDECPLAILMRHPPSKGTITFSLRKRKPDMQKRKKKKTTSGSKVPGEEDYPRYDLDIDHLPCLLELMPDGTEPRGAKKIPLPLNVTEVGAERSMAMGGQYLQLYGPDIRARHCIIAHTDGIVTITPNNKDCDTYIDNQRIYETTMLQNGMLVCFGKANLFRFLGPRYEDKVPGTEGLPVLSGPPPYDPRQQGPNQTANFETTFDVNGQIETISNQEQQYQKMMEGRYGSVPPGYDPGRPEDLLPAVLEFREEGEDAFLSAIVSEVHTAAVQFKLAPTYTLYMSARYRLSKLYRPDISPPERAHRLAAFLNKIAAMVHRTIQENRENPGALSFWMANASELLHFVKQDGGLCGPALDAQDTLAESVQVAFRFLVHCMQMELRNTMVAFLDEADDDLDDDGDVLQVLSSTMSLLRRCRVNAALTIQLFSQLFHYINMWLFNKLVLEPRLGLCTRLWGHRLKRRLGRVEIWAEKQGLELAADCHLARIIQAAHLLQAPKSSADDIASISSTCFKLNSLQLRALLSNYIPGPGEPRIPGDLIDSVVSVAENTADELTRSDGRDVRLEEEPDLQLPFLLPEDGYSCDIVRGVPNGLAEFLDPLSATGLCRLTVQPMAPGLWTVYMTGQDPANLRGMQQPMDGGGEPTGPQVKEPDVIVVTFSKVSGSMGLSIVAARGEGQERRGIYIKSVVTGGAAALDGRLQAGDQLLEVDGKNLIGLSQEKAAELMTKTDHTVTLKVAKQGAIYHGLGALLSQPSPIMQRASPRRSQGAGGKGLVRPKSEEVSRFNGPQDGSPMMPREYRGPEAPPGGGMYDSMRPIHHQHGAQSSPALAASRSHEQLRDVGDPYGSYRPTPGMTTSRSYYDVDRQPAPQNQYRDAAARSKSTSNLDRPDVPYDGRQNMSTSTLPRQTQQFHPQRGMEHLNRPTSQTELHQSRREEPPADMRRTGPEYDQDYENYPAQPQQPPPSQPPQQAPGSRYSGPPRDPRFMGPQQPQQQPQPSPQQPNYVNHQELQNQYQYKGAMDPRSVASMSNLNEDPAHQRPEPAMRPKSMDMMERWGQRQPPVGYSGQPQQGMSPVGIHGPPGMDPQGGPPRSMAEEVPRIQGGPQYQQKFFQNTAPRTREVTPPFEQLRRPQDQEDQRPRPSPAPKPAVPNKPTIKPQEVPRMHVDSRQQQPNFFDPRNQQQPPPPAQPQPPLQQPHSPQVSVGAYPQPGQYQTVSSTDTRTVYSHSVRDKPSPGGRADMYRRNQSPDFPPPPPDVPPPTQVVPHDDRWPQYGEELPPPPPPPGGDPEQQIREEQERMMRRMAGMDLQGHDPRDTRDRLYDQQQPTQQPRFSSNQQQPEPQPQHQRTSPPSGHQQNYNNYQNLGQGRPSMGQEPGHQQQRPQYPYNPKPQSNRNGSTQPRSNANLNPPPGANITPKRPPVAVKPKLLAKPPSGGPSSSPSPSPWERDEKERQEKQKEVDITRLRDTEIAELEGKPYLAPEEHERLRRLRLDQEFERRVKEASKDEDEGGDSDNDDITDRAAGRAILLRRMQEDLEKKRQQIMEGHVQRDRDAETADREMAERQERRLQMFEQEREEQRQRQLKRQEKRERETEEYLRKQRELRERQRREQEEQQRNLRLEEERLREKQREELRRKREMEKEQLREMALTREAEERAMREAARRQDEEIERQRMAELKQEREAQAQNDLRRMERYAHLQYTDPSQRPPPTSAPHQNLPPQPAHPPPTPPERRSSYDVANQHSLRPGQGMPPYDPALNQPQTPRSQSNSALRQAETPSSAKKSVSFDSNLATEISESRQYGSTSSESSLYQQHQLPHQPPPQQQQQPYQPPPQQMPPYQPPPQQQHQLPPGQRQHPDQVYVFRGSSGSSSSDPPTPFQRPNYGTPSHNNDNVFDHRTPTNQGPEATLVPGPTPGVVGAQEVYRDPRERIAAQKANNHGSRNPGPERMSFRDKMSMFAKEAGEQYTPKEKQKTSRAQRVIEVDLNGQSVA